MSEENVQIVRQVVEEFEAGMERGDPGAAFDTGAIADDYEHILEVNELEGRSVWRGRAPSAERYDRERQHLSAPLRRTLRSCKTCEGGRNELAT